jgi:Zn-dependent peptidase ImmA (M78 family)/transcriptional regulator with XRE-family HTH domain
MDRGPDFEAQVARADLVVLARESRGLTQSALAARLNVSQGHLSKIEAGMLTVSQATLERLAGVLGYPEHFFMLREPIYGPGTSEFFHRKRSAMSARLLSQVHAVVNIRRIQVARMMRAVDLDEDRIPELNLEDFGDSPEEVARVVRAAWSLPRGPLANLTDVVEAAGGVVVPIDFGTTLIDAVGRYVPGMPPLFFVSRNAPPDRTRLTLAHELGHMVMHRVPNGSMEDQAFRFGAELLMPEQDIKVELDGLSIDTLVWLKLRWRVSMGALLKRAESLGRIQPRRARYLWMSMSKAGYRTREPAEGDIAPELPHTLKDIVDTHLRQLAYSVEDLAHLVALSPSELEATYGIGPAGRGDARGRLHIVRSSA